jgi:hypothetical protein
MIINRRIQVVQWLAIGLLMMVFCCGCRARQGDEILVEVEPGKFIKVEKLDRSDSTRLVIKTNGEEIVWDGKEIPFLLRRFENRYYIVGYDQAAGLEFAIKWGNTAGSETEPYPKVIRYFMQDGNRFITIRKENFPPKIAYQNMWISEFRLPAIRDRDISSYDFIGSPIAFVWADLLDEYPKRTQHEITVELLQRFIDKYQPYRLTFSPPN